MQSTFYCPACRAPVAYGQDLCRNCGTRLTWPSQQQLYYCPYCSSIVTYGQAACRLCGTTMAWTEQQTSQSQASQSYGVYDSYGQAAHDLQQQAYGQQTGWNQLPQFDTVGVTDTQEESARSWKRLALTAFGLLLTLIVGGGALIIGMNWNSITSSMRGNDSNSGTPANPTGELVIVSFTASPNAIGPGQKSTLQWNTNGATSVSIDHDIGKVAIAGSYVVSPSANTTYKLIATNSSIAKSATAEIVIASPPVISMFTAAPTVVNAGQTATLQWTITGASSIIIDHGVGSVPASGSSPVSLSENTTYTLTAAGPAGTVKASATVTIAGANPPVISAFSANPIAINSGQASTLQWNVTGAPSVSIDHNIGAVSPGGSVPVSPSENTTYTLTATNNSGSVRASAVVTVSQSRPPVIGSFTATPAAISAGQSSTLQWAVTGATVVTINQGVGTVNTSGTLSVSPSDNKTYILSASNGGSPVTATATLSVVPTGTPIITSFNAVPGVITAGQSTELRWNVSGATSVTIDQGIGTVALSGTTQVSPTTHKTYKLTATGTTGSASASVIVTVSQPSTVTINSFTSSPARVNAGDQSTLQWNVSGATAVTIDHDIGSVSLQGMAPVTPTENTTYTLSATGSSGTVAASTLVSVVPAGTPVITSFTAAPSEITAGQSSTLEWNVTGANSVSIDSGIGTVSVAGSATITPSDNTTYTLTAQGNSGTASSTVTVTVNPTP